jgi:hypothetical protein
MKTTQERLSEVYSRLSDENAESEKQQLRGAAIAAGCYGGVYFVHSYYGGLPKPSEYTFHISEVNGSIRGVAGKYFEGELKDCGKTEVQFSHFIDLLNDSIVPWRLEADGFIDKWNGSFLLPIKGKADIKIHRMARGISVEYHAPFEGIKTYTDLITLIRLIG